MVFRELAVLSCQIAFDHPTGVEHFPQTKIGIFSSMTLAKALLKGGSRPA
jgi:hypothetical protein